MHTDTSQDRDTELVHIVPKDVWTDCGIFVTYCGIDKSGTQPRWDREPNCVVCLEMSKHKSM